MAHVAHVNARAIRASEERLKFAIEGSGDGIWEYSTTTHLLSLSARSACILGLPENEVHMEVEDFLSLAHPDDRERVGASLNECFLAPSREVGEECRILRPAGEVGWVLLRGKALGGSRSGTERRIFGTLSDITSRKHGEQLLERERLLLKTLIDTLPAHIYVKDREHRFVHCNSSVVNALGAASADEILGNTDEAYFSPVIVGQYREEEDRILSGEASSVHHENAIRYPDGQYRWMTSTKVPIKGPNGEIDLLVGINVDITARRRMEDALKASEARYRELADTLPEMVFEADALGIITFVNLRATQILGRGEAEILNRASVFDFLAAGDVERARTTARKILTEGTSSKGHYTLIHHNGSHIPVMVHTSPIVKHGVATGIRGVVVELRSMVVNDPLSLPSSPNVRRTPLETPVEQAGTNHG
jgi:PAS domain S-box-containing protein